MNKNNLKNEKIPFTQIPNELLADNISSGAMRVYCYLRSKPDDWAYWNSEIMKSINIKNKGTLAKYFKELMNAGWISRERVYTNGRISGGYDYKTYIRKNLNQGKTFIKKNTTLRKNPDHSNTNLINNTNSNSNTNLIPKIKDFEMLEKIYKHFHKLKRSQGYYPPNNKQQSIDTLEKVIRIDKLPLTELKALIGFAVNDDRDNFNWQKNLISLASLRSKSKSNGMKKWQNIHKDLITTGKKQVDKLNKDKEQQRIYEELNL